MHKPALALIPLAAALALSGCGHSSEAPAQSKPLVPAPSAVVKKTPVKAPVAPRPAPVKTPVALQPAATTSPVSLTPQAPAVASLPGVLMTLSSLGRVQVEKSFATPVAGVTGYLVKQSGHYNVLYGTTGGYLIAGAILSPKGQNLSAQYQNQYAPKPDISGILGKIAADKSVFTVGTKGPILTAFVDPNCIFCHKMEVAAAPYVKAGELRMRYVMVAFLQADSAGRAAAILAAPDRAAAMEENRVKYDVAHEEGGYPALASPSPDVMATLKTHMDWMGELGSNGTPTIVFQGPDGHWQAKGGWPGDMWLKTYIAKHAAPTQGAGAPVPAAPVKAP